MLLYYYILFHELFRNTVAYYLVMIDTNLKKLAFLENTNMPLHLPLPDQHTRTTWNALFLNDICSFKKLKRPHELFFM